jgi:putative pyruvate formate lyase activating enzyme
MPESSTNTATNASRPRYLQAWRQGTLREKIEQGLTWMADCALCPRECRVNRLEVGGGTCKIGRQARVSSYFPHFGEEECITGYRGSGTIFFTSCNLRCVFCQNWDISHSHRGRDVTPVELARMMIHLQELGCHNINFVTPSHVVVPILEALELAIEMGLRIPLVYNTSAYDSRENLELLDGIVDIYMPDFKFWSAAVSKRYLKAPDYPEVARRNLKIMHRQVGDLIVDAWGVAVKGLLVRHLVMPNLPVETDRILSFLATEISPETMVNVMFQYRPNGKVNTASYPELNRILTVRERSHALHLVRTAGLTRLA